MAILCTYNRSEGDLRFVYFGEAMNHWWLAARCEIIVQPGGDVTTLLWVCVLVCVPAQGAWSAGDQKCRWNDLVEQDLVKCGIEQDWSELAQDRSAWRGVVEMCVDTINKEAEHKEDRKKDERKRTKQSLSPWRRPEHLVETLARFFKAGMREQPLSHDQASCEALTSVTSHCSLWLGSPVTIQTAPHS